jgi:hypothetical protein
MAAARLETSKAWEGVQRIRRADSRFVIANDEAHALEAARGTLMAARREGRRLAAGKGVCWPTPLGQSAIRT